MTIAESNLIEREREKIFLEATLQAVASNQPDRPRSIFLTGPAGRGRTALLDWVAKQSPKFGLTTLGHGWTWPAGSEGLATLRPILPPTVVETFDQLRAKLSEIESQVETMQLALGFPDLTTATQEERYRAVQAIPPQALHFLIRRLYTVYTPGQLSEQAAAFVKTGLEHIVTLTAINLAQLQGFVAEVQVALGQTAWDFYLRPEENLAVKIGQALAAAGPLLIQIKEFVQPQGTSDRWLRRLIEESGASLWLFSALVAPGWATDLPLAPLSPAGIASYVKSQYGRDLTETERDWLSGLTGGEPLTTALATQLWAAGRPQADLEAAVARTSNDPLDGLFLYFVEEGRLLNEAEHGALYVQALLHQPDTDFLARFEAAVRKAKHSFDRGDWSELLRKFSWLNDGQGYLHPALARRLREYLLIERRRFSIPVQEAIIEPARNVALERLVAQETTLLGEPGLASLAARASSETWGDRVADLAYYRFWLDEAVGWFFLLPRWLMALAYNEGLARRLLALAEELSSTFYAEGQEILPQLRTLLNPVYTGGRARLDAKFKALEVLEELGTSGRGRWYRAENLGQRPGGAGSPEAELRGLLKWFGARLLEESGQYERVAPLYESVLATNVAMPQMEQAAGRAALYLATRYRLKGAAENAYSALNRAVELWPDQPTAWLSLYYQSLRTRYFQTALKVADWLSEHDPSVQNDLFSLVALVGLERWTEVQTELRSFLAQPANQTVKARPTFEALLNLAALDPTNSELAALLAQLPA